MQTRWLGFLKKGYLQTEAWSVIVKSQSWPQMVGGGGGGGAVQPIIEYICRRHAVA